MVGVAPEEFAQDGKSPLNDFDELISATRGNIFNLAAYLGTDKIEHQVDAASRPRSHFFERIFDSLATRRVAAKVFPSELLKLSPTELGEGSSRFEITPKLFAQPL